MFSHTVHVRFLGAAMFRNIRDIRVRGPQEGNNPNQATIAGTAKHIAPPAGCQAPDGR